ncbi:galectin-12 isoform X2 [Sciurus carolinensis]|uniref:galectin-12 isoform X2 n=1 Tax=Sciurus carolinensis TaxID=30640 RepID=UPI001FB44A45|nr:galectin-12 isoform X2 [Sciurus carolinensis]
MVMLQGVVPLRAHRFQVDFQCGCSLRPQPDIAIHFNPRFHTTKPHVICNTLLSGRWQREARWPGLALQRGAGFLILFLFGNEEVKVSVDGRHFLHYRYRIPLSRVDTLGIFGDILVKAVGFLNISPFQEGSREYPTGHPFLLQSPRLVRSEPEGRGRPCSCDTQGVLHRQNAGLGVALGTQEADLSPLPFSPPAILRGAAPVPGGGAEAGTQWTGCGHHQPGPADPGEAAGAPDPWKHPTLLCPLLRRIPRGPGQREEGQSTPRAHGQAHSAAFTRPSSRHRGVRPGSRPGHKPTAAGELGPQQRRHWG